MSLEDADEEQHTFAIGRGISSSSLEYLRHTSSNGSSSASPPQRALHRGMLSSSSSFSQLRLPHHHRKTLVEIRSHAKKHRVTLRDTVESLSRSILRICQVNDQRLKTATPPSRWYDHVTTTPWEDGGHQDVVKYVWRLVSELNASKEPVLFRHDGQAVDHAATAASGTVPTGVEASDSAMGRGLRCLLFAIVYIDRMCAAAAASAASSASTSLLTSPPPTSSGLVNTSAGAFQLTSRNVHIVLLGSIYLAHKFSDDAPIRMARFAYLGGVATSVLRRIEVAICLQIGFDLFISEDQFDNQSLVQLDKAVRAAACRMAKQHPAAQALQQQQQQQFGLGGSTPVLGQLPTAKRKHVPH